MEMDTKTQTLQHISGTTGEILTALGGTATETDTAKDADIGLLQTISTTTDAILEAVEAGGGGGGGGGNYVTTDGEQTLSNKTYVADAQQFNAYYKYTLQYNGVVG